MRAFYLAHKKLHRWLLLSGAVLLLFYALRGNRAVMNAFVGRVTLPLEQALGAACALVPFSVAELFYVLLALAALVFLVRSVVLVRRAQRRADALYGRALLLVNVALTLYAAFCLLWGANYYIDDFCDESGLAPQPVSVEELYRVTDYFAQQLADCADEVARDSRGVFAAPREEILPYAAAVYDTLYEEFPFLRMTDHAPKGIHFSKVMSAMNFTGFYFPFTGESNVNMDSPAAHLPATCAHELAHRRGIASEQQCNFLAVLACTRCDNAAYNYSGWLLGYIHLSNALYSADIELWRAVAAALPDTVRADLAENRAYWAEYEGLTATVSDRVYDSMLKGYGDALGVKSYGAVVDLLVAYYR